MPGHNFIAFQKSAEGSKSFQSSNPQTGELHPVTFIQASPEEINRAVELAANAFLTFNFMAPSRRAEFLHEISNQIKGLGDNLLHSFCFESGLNEERAQQELARTIFQLESFADALKQGKFFGTKNNSSEKNFLSNVPKLERRLQGLGPVVVFGASNFPLAYSTAGGDTASALAAGCPVIVKSHPMHAATSALVAGAIVKAAEITKMPEGVFSHLNALDLAVGEQLVKHPKVKAVGFTGSLAGGRALFDIANARLEPIPVFAEMGSINPIIFLEEFLDDFETQVEIIANSICNAAGQFCTKPGLLFVPAHAKSTDFIGTLGRKIQSVAPQTMLGVSIQEKFTSLKNKSFDVPYEKRYESQNGADHEVSSALLCINEEQFRANPFLADEVFGPFSIVVTYSSNEELEQMLELFHGSLTASVFCGKKKVNYQDPLIQLLSLKAGRIILNGVPTGVTVSGSMTHGGPYPASTDGRFSAVGLNAIYRWLRPVTYQNF